MKRALALISIAVVIGVAVFAYLRISANSFSARAEPTGIEKFLARTARSLALPDRVKSQQNPEPDTTEILSEAREHWADHCAGCHGNNGSGDTEMGRVTCIRARRICASPRLRI